MSVRPWAGLLALMALVHVTSVAGRAIDAADLRRHIDILASDAFQGRSPGGPGGELTRAYIADQWRRIGLVPGVGDDWEQPVSIVQRRPIDQAASFRRRGRIVVIPTDRLLLLSRDTHDLVDAPVVFLGTLDPTDDPLLAGGIAGKVVIVTAQQSGDADAINAEIARRRLSLAQAGAAGVILMVPDSADWAKIARGARLLDNSLAGAQDRAPIEGFASESFVVALVTSGGGDWDRLRARAASEGFLGLDLGVDAHLSATASVRRVASANIIGRIAGQRPGSGAVLFMAHWDHLGICRPDDPVHSICNGAVDNASGVALITEVARVLAEHPADRDIWFVATTGEEEGFLGAKEFIAQPPLPLDSIVAAFNIDTVAIAPRGRPVALIGKGSPAMIAAIREVARRLGRTLAPAGIADDFRYRLDGWPMEQAGVPTVMLNSSFSDRAALADWMRRRYHQPTDRDDDGLELGGAVDDANLYAALGTWFGSTDQFPTLARSTAMTGK